MIIWRLINKMAGIDGFRGGLIVLMIITGAINTLDDKYQNSQIVIQGGIEKSFYHPYMQTTAVFIGESMALPLFFILKKRDHESFRKRKEEAKAAGKITQFNRIRVAVSALCDVFASTMQCIALNFVAGSAYQMMRGGTIATTFLFTVIYLKQKAHKNQMLGSGFAILGVLIVGAANLIYSASSGGSQNTGLEIIGYVLLIFSLFLNGFQFAYQEGIFEKYHIQPVQMVGIQGLFGLTINLIMIAAFTFIPCNFGEDACVYTDEGPFLERPDVYFRQLGDNHVLMIFCIIYVFSVMTFNITGLSITRYINALARAVCDVSRTVIIWLVGIIVTLTVGQRQPNYLWERTQAGAVVLQLIGFSLIVLGNLVYNKIVQFPCLLNQQQKKSLLQAHQSQQ